MGEVRAKRLWEEVFVRLAESESHVREIMSGPLRRQINRCESLMERCRDALDPEEHKDSN